MDQIIEQLKKSKYTNYYLNIVCFRNGKWGIVWSPEHSGATRKSEAVKQRKEFYKHLKRVAPSVWSRKDLKTIKII